MVKRPLGDRRPLGPFLSPSKAESEEVKTDNSSNPTYNSLDELPDSPMLEEYVTQIMEKTGKSEEEVINSKPVERYMKRLGVL